MIKTFNVGLSLSDLLFCFVTSCKYIYFLIQLEKSGITFVLIVKINWLSLWFTGGSSMGQRQCKEAELSCHRRSLFSFVKPFPLGQCECCPCFVLSKFLSHSLKTLDWGLYWELIKLASLLICVLCVCHVCFAPPPPPPLLCKRPWVMKSAV